MIQPQKILARIGAKIGSPLARMCQQIKSRLSALHCAGSFLDEILAALIGNTACNISHLLYVVSLSRNTAAFPKRCAFQNLRVRTLQHTVDIVPVRRNRCTVATCLFTKSGYILPKHFPYFRHCGAQLLRVPDTMGERVSCHLLIMIRYLSACGSDLLDQ